MAWLESIEAGGCCWGERHVLTKERRCSSRGLFWSEERDGEVLRNGVRRRTAFSGVLARDMVRGTVVVAVCREARC